MAADVPNPRLPADIEDAVRMRVDSVVSSKVNSYKRVVYAFLLGFGFIFSILLANQLISQKSILVYLHDELFGSDREMLGIIDTSVALSYSSQFVLLPDTPVQYLAFYANDPQTVIALVDIKHSGPEQRNSRVIIRLDRLREPIWSGDDDVNFETINLTENVRRPAVLSPAAAHVHNLTFQIDPVNPNPSDKVDVRILVNVFGLEHKLK